MKIGIIGATGKAGNFILQEAKHRGHEVTAIIRNSSKLEDTTISVREKDIFALTNKDLQSFDVVVNAFGAAPGQEHLHIEAGKVLITALQGNEHTRLFVVGGAGSLFVDEAKTTRLYDTSDFPAEYLPTAKNQGQNLEDLRQSSINWTFLSPAGFFNPMGKRTGAYQVGKDNLMVNEKGDSYISYADYAIAVVDEIEEPKHINERFTVVAEAE